ncbi:autotransporter-associated beta strand protein [Roseimicrobium gellanilyticum]|uniref:Autotransporter-associated beta strand protein n=1 Tax=Roseimicrobium gellanilyticum TaxID=748857 RepID=A0A366HBD4_9BACT|nr:autotransporter-associated beta strand repeat-containing protein [Roseimicrobium gellanilyticum]RBP39068.1 autotransporter-associated beta strand protein [Roseimicrobium gellanilyticum]
MKPRLLRLLALSSALGFAIPVTAENENEIGFIERFALAADREKVLAELVPGTEDFYFYHALHYQNSRNAAKFSDIMAQWKKRFPDDTHLREMIENREALLSYDANPQATIAYIKRKLDIRHDHQQEVRDRKPDLPTALDAQFIARKVFLADALINDNGLQGLSQVELETLIRDNTTLSPAQARALLAKLQRPDVANLVEFIARELRSQNSSGFGAFNIHRQLLPEQLTQLAQQVPKLSSNDAYVRAMLRKLAPSADVDLTYDDAEREAWLDRAWAYVKTLPSAFNSLKAQVIYQRLDHDRKKGVYDRERFIEYLKLPRQQHYVREEMLERAAEAQVPMANLHANYADALLGRPPIVEDEPLVREYFLELFVRNAATSNEVEAALSPYTEYVRAAWLKPVFAEAMVLAGQGSPERWASLLSPQAFQALKDRVDILFPSTNTVFFRPGDEVKFDVTLKNTPQLIVKIYELNTLNFFQTQGRQLNTDLNLDGLVANKEQTHTYENGPFKRSRQTFTFDELRGKRGAWVIEFIGGGRSSRALVRVGQWQVLEQPGPTGTLLLVLDENGNPVKDAVAWVDGRKLTRDEKLERIIVPFTNQPQRKSLIVSDAAGTFATFTQFTHQAENYHLDAQFHIEREQLLARREATLAVRVALMLGNTHLAPELLKKPKLLITSTTQDGISTTREVKDLKLSAGSVLLHNISVPERLAKLNVTLAGEIEILSNGGEKRPYSASHSWDLNGMDTTDATNDGHLSKFGDGYEYELLGKNGEVTADQQIVFTFRRKGFNRPITIPLRTDEKGRVALGTLEGISSVGAKSPNGRQSSWSLDDAERTWSSVVNAKSGEVVRIPAPVGFVDGGASLLATRAGTFVSNESEKMTLRDGFLVIEGLTPGDYSLRLRTENRDIAIKVTDGKPMGGWLLGKNRLLELRGTAPLQITSLQTDNEFVTVKLANHSPFTRVHIGATRFESGRSIFHELGRFARFGASEGRPAKLPNLYAAGREIGDEYRYILERRYAKLFPGNMLTRPGLLLNPWAIQDTSLEDLAQRGGEAAGQTRGGAAGAMSAAKAESPPAPPPPAGGTDSTNIDFLANTAPVIYNLLPDKDGVVRIARKELGDRQQIQVYAEDLENAVWQKLSLPEAGTKFADQRLVRNLDPAKPFTQRREVTVLQNGKALTLGDILTSEMETYDTLGGVYSLFTTLSSDEKLGEFAWILDWPKMKDEEKRAKYSEFACHELSFFLAKKDQAFFNTVIKPYLASKKDKTFMDDFLLGLDLKKYLEPWSYGRLNTVERSLLAQRIDGEGLNTARHLKELWEMIPPNPDEQDRLFETALRGRVLEDTEGRGLVALGLSDEKRKVEAEAAKNVPKPMAMSAPATATPAPAPMAPADSFAVAESPPVGGTRGRLGAIAGREMQRSLTTGDMAVLAEATDKDMEALPELQVERSEAKKREHAMGGVVLGAGAIVKAGNGYMTLDGTNTYTGGTTITAGTLAYFGNDEAAKIRLQFRAMYRALGPTKEWAENNYYKLRIEEQIADLVPVNAFWRDYAAWVASGSKGPFVSTEVAESHRNFTEMMLALAVLDLPFDAPKHLTKSENGQFTLTAAGPVIVYHKEIKPATESRKAVPAVAPGPEGIAPGTAFTPDLLVSQVFFRHGDRYRQVGNEQFEKYVTAEFLTGAVYGANVVVTNPTSSPAKAEVLLQIPQGSLPVAGSKATNSRRVQLAPYTTQTFEYYFYFPATPAAGTKFAHFPVSVAVSGNVAGTAKAFEFPVVAKLTQVDKASWDYVSQEASDADTLAFIAQNNIETLPLERIAWRCKKPDFYRQLVKVMAQRHVWNDTIGTYSLLHNDTPSLREWLKHRDDFTDHCGAYLATKLVLLDPIERHDYEHLEYSPLINQRAHRVGNEWRIANPMVLDQYDTLLGVLSQKPQLDAIDSMSVVYYLFLQDRVEEALARFKTIDANALPTKLQHDYFRCYAAFYEGNLGEARTLATKYADHSVNRWKNLFAEVTSQLDEIEGRDAKPGDKDKPDREKQQGELAATEPGFDFKVENRTISLNWQNLGEVVVNYYLMDPEFSFSSSPFVSQDASRFSIIKPNLTATQALPAGATTVDVPLPAQFAKANVLVEIVGAGQRKAKPYHANTLKLAVTENYGRLETRDSSTDKPVSKAYVKVYARLNDGTVRFFKDGYTDLRGRFDYASLNSSAENVPVPPPVPLPRSGSHSPSNGLDHQMLKPSELGQVQKLALLILSDTHGATTREVDPPQQ